MAKVFVSEENLNHLETMIGRNQPTVTKVLDHLIKQHQRDQKVIICKDNK